MLTVANLKIWQLRSNFSDHLELGLHVPDRFKGHPLFTSRFCLHQLLRNLGFLKALLCSQKKPLNVSVSCECDTGRVH